MEILISVRRVNALLLGGWLLVTALGLATELIARLSGDDWFYSLVQLFNLSYEANFPTWYVSIVLFGCAVLLFMIAWAAAARYRRHWTLLGGLFLYISIDEIAMIHERANAALDELLDIGGMLAWPWVLPASVLVLVLAFTYRNFLGHLAPRFRRRFVVAGVIYVGGALGTEFPLAWWYDLHGRENMVYGLASLAQESLEILGASIFCAALCAYLAAYPGALRLGFAEAERRHFRDHQ